MGIYNHLQILQIIIHIIRIRYDFRVHKVNLSERKIQIIKQNYKQSFRNFKSK